jgi:hypothetical protein
VSDRERASSLWKQADNLREKGKRLRSEGDSLIRAADRLNAFAAAIADGREQDVREIAKDMAGRP